MKVSIISKHLDRESNHFIFTFQLNDKTYFRRTAAEIFEDKALLQSLTKMEIFDVGFVCGSESVMRERELIKNLKNQIKKAVAS